VCAGFDVLRDSGHSADGAPAATAAASSGPRPEVDELFGRLKLRRKQLAAARHVPAYVVFSDATLLRIAEQRPRSDQELLAISGIGPAKLELYGPALLDLVAGAAVTAAP
jgi:superfamily II DNA helicase RecQ